MKRSFSVSDFLSTNDYERIRTQKRNEIIALKKKRRVSVGPDVTFYFENYDTLWLQVQEMLRSEKGGEAQLLEELRAYNPLVPNGHELVATVMFEIEDAARRTQILSSLGGVENNMEIRLGDTLVAGQPEGDLDYTSSEGKASSVHFIHFPFTTAQIEEFRGGGVEVGLAITHPGYRFSMTLPLPIRQELAKDFAPR